MELNKFKKLSVSSDFQQILPISTYGKDADEIVIDELFAIEFALIGQHCPKLQSIIITDALLISKNMADFKSMILGLKNLKSVQLNVYHSEISEVVVALKELVNLKSLSLYIEECKQLPLDLADLHKLVHLETLQIKGQQVVLNINDISDLRMLRSLKICSAKIILNAPGIALGLSALEKLKISYCHIEASFPDCQKLQTLHIKQTTFTSDFCKWLSMKLKTLESLQTDNSLFEQSVLSEIYSSPHSDWVLPVLKDLAIYEVSSPLTFILPYCPMLTSLNMAQVDEYPFPKECFDWITKHTSSINSLILPGLIFGENCLDLPFFPKLRSFLLNSSYGISPDRFFNWISKCTTTMEILNIYGDLDRNRLLNLLSDCKNIRTFGVARTRPVFTENFFRSLFDILKKNGVTPDDPFKFRLSPFTMCRTKVDTLPHSELCKIQLDDKIGTIYENLN